MYMSLEKVMVYRILPATPADLPDVIAIFHAAFAADPFVGQLMTNVPPEVKLTYDMHWYGHEFEMSELNGLQLRKIVDGDGYDDSLGQNSTVRPCTHWCLERR